MDRDKSLQVRKENFFTKFINFFKGLLKKDKNNLGYTQKDIILQKERVRNIITPVEKKEFKDGVKVEVKTDETLNLQKQFESNEESANNMTDEQINSLILLYKDQVATLREKINMRRAELEKMNSISTL